MARRRQAVREGSPHPLPDSMPETGAASVDACGPLCRRFREIRSYAVGLTVVGFLADLPLIANPGLYSHDELSAVEEVRQRGIFGYAWHYTADLSSRSFGAPYAPLGRLALGGLAAAYAWAPWLCHVLDVVLHVLAALAVALLADQLLGRRAARVAGCLFVVSPLATLAVGWTGAVYDRLFSLFAFLAMACFVRYLRCPRLRLLLTMSVLVFAAALSKQTAMGVPVALMGVSLMALHVNRGVAPRTHMRRAVTGIVVSGLAYLPFLALRWNALVGTLTGDSTGADGAYRLHPGLIPQRLAVFAAYPFLPHLLEAGNFVFYSRAVLVSAVLIHAALIALAARRIGVAWATGYVLLYGAFLLPVLAIPNLNSQYLYAAALPLALLLAMLLGQVSRERRRLPSLSASAAGLLAAVLFAHHVANANAIYRVGQCQRRLLDSLEVIAASDRDGTVAVRPDAGSPSYVVLNAMVGGRHLGGRRVVNVVVLPVAGGPPAEARFSASCLVFPLFPPGR
jgi:hypothetical protein